MKDRDIKHLGLTFLDACVLIDWRRTERGRRWRLVLGAPPLLLPLEMPPRRQGRLFKLAWAWYPKRYEP